MPGKPQPVATWSLIERALDGDALAREEFGRNYERVVRRTIEARWHGTPLASEVDDAVQEVFVECLRRGGALERAEERRGELGALLFGVARNVALRFEERASRRIGSERAPSLSAIEAREPSLSALFDREWARTLVRLAGERMRELAEGDGPGARLRVELLRLRFTEGLALREIAAAWEVDPDSVHRAYAKARSEFRDSLRRVVAEQSAAGDADLESAVRRVFELLD